MVKETFVVILSLQGLNVALDEVIKVTQSLLDRFGDIEVHELTVIPAVFASAPRRDQG